MPINALLHVLFKIKIEDSLEFSKSAIMKYTLEIEIEF